MDPASDALTRVAVEEHWHASERGDSEAEHAVHAEDAIRDHPQSGERFPDGFGAPQWRAALAEPMPGRMIAR